MPFSTYIVLLVLLLIAGVWVEASPAGTSNGESDISKTPIHRLPNDVIPLEYELHIVPYLEPDFKYSGSVRIKIEAVSNDVDEIVLHSKNLEIQKLELHIHNITIDWLTPAVDIKNELLRIGKVKICRGCVANLIIWFSGKLTDETTGFYRSSYKNGNGWTWLASTHFLPTDARKAFPCFDEPRYRVPFQINIAKLPHQVIMSNMPVDEQNNGENKTIFPVEGRKWVRFLKTPPMPTYLVAFVISDFGHVPALNQTAVNVWGRSDILPLEKYAYTKSVQLLVAMESFIGMKYMLPKLDLVAIPDFKASAMENWGLNTYGERFLVCNVESSPEEHLEAISRIMSHLIAHQWFGDYVSPTWWDYLWMNEAFAVYFEYHLPATVEPNWRYKEWFVVDVLQSALFAEPDYDHALTASVQSVPEIKSLFDIVTYNKGASVLRMLEHILSTVSFKEALQIYLNKGHAKPHFGLVTPRTFFTVLKYQVIQDSIDWLPEGITIADIMETWTNNIGYPLLKVTRNISTQTYFIEQEPYASPGTEKPLPKQEWIVPISYTTGTKCNFNMTKPQIWSMGNKLVEVNEKLDPNEWVLLNIQQTGYFRVNYDEQNWNLLTNQLLSDFRKIDVVNRAQILDDAFSLALDEKLRFTVPLALANYLRKECDVIPWSTAIRHFNYLYDMSEDMRIVQENLRKYFVNTIAERYRMWTFYESPSENHQTRKGRSVILKLACKLGIEDCLISASEEYEKNKDYLEKVPANLKELVYCYAVRNARNLQLVWNQFWDLYHKTEIAYDKEIILKSFGCTQHKQFLREYLLKLTNSTTSMDVRNQDYPIIMKSVCSSAEGITIALQFVKEKLEATKEIEIKDSDIEMLQELMKIITGAAIRNNHVLNLQELYKDTNKLDPDKLEPLIRTIELAYNKGLKLQAFRERRLGELNAAVEDELKHGSVENPNTSSSNILQYSPISYLNLLVLVSLWVMVLK